jgi:basic amino acid/polyamine antiporter, APA family
MASTPTPTSARDAGLVRGIGPWALTGAFVGILVGSGIFNVPAPMAAAVGRWAPLAYLACGLAVGAVMLCFAEAASRVPTSGGVAGFIGAAFGPYWGFLIGVLNWAAAVVSAGAIGAAIADVVGTVLPALAAGPARTLALVAFFFGLAALNVVGVGLASRVVAIAIAVKLVPLALFIGVGLWFIDPGSLAAPATAGAATVDIGRAAILGIFLFTGIEASMAVSGEVRDPSRNIPRAIIGSIAGYAVLCIAVQTVAQGLLGAALATSVAPLADAIGTVSPVLRLVLVAGAAVSMAGWLASDALSSPRMLFAMARGGFLPAPIGRLHPRNATPWVASVVHAGIAVALAVSGSFAALAILATLIVIIIYITGCAAALVLRRRDVALAGPPLRIPALTAFAIAGSAAMLWVAAQSTLAEALGIALLIGLTTIVYGLRRQTALASF